MSPVNWAEMQVIADRLIAQGNMPLQNESMDVFIARVMGKQVGAGYEPVPFTGTPVAVVPTPAPVAPVTKQPALITTTQMPVAAPRTGDPVSAITGALPAAVPAGLTALGLGGLATLLGGAYGISQAIGVQYPWETGAGEGFIAPWTRDIVQDEQGKWVTRSTRPDLFGNGAAPSAAMVPAAAGVGVGAAVVKVWDTGWTDAQGVYHPGWPFAMTSDGYIHTVTKAGVRRRYKPYRSVVLGKNPSPRMIGRAVNKLVQFDKVHERIKKLARRLKT